MNEFLDNANARWLANWLALVVVSRPTRRVRTMEIQERFPSWTPSDIDGAVALCVKYNYAKQDEHGVRGMTYSGVPHYEEYKNGEPESFPPNPDKTFWRWSLDMVDVAIQEAYDDAGHTDYQSPYETYKLECSLASKQPYSLTQIESGDYPEYE